MAVSVNRIAKFVPGAGREVVADITGDTSYPTGGWPLPPSALGLDIIDFLECANSGGTTFEYNHTTQKLLAFRTGSGANAALAEVANATNLSAVTARVRACGRGGA
jgi:hypothetical protein